MTGASRPLLAAALALALAGCASLAPLSTPAAEDPAEAQTGEAAAPAPEAAAKPAEAAPASAPEHAADGTAPHPPPRIASGEALFARLAARLTPPICIRGKHNRQWRRRFAADPHAFARQLRVALPLLAWVVEETERRNLPGEFALIPLVESGYRVDARARGGPLGLWQMMPRTARHYGITISGGFDGRLSPVDATDAALAHLDGLLVRLDDWQAAAMAYNAGEGRLRGALAGGPADARRRRVSGERRLPEGLAPVTYSYVAKLRALACLVAEPERARLVLPANTFIPLQRLEAPAGTRRLADAAAAWSVDVSELVRWNAGHRAQPWPVAATRGLLAPMADEASTPERTVGDASPPRHTGG